MKMIPLHSLIQLIAVQVAAVTLVEDAATTARTTVKTGQGDPRLDEYR